jgi:alpha-tubulin suppressor-like RCC1 family protein
MLNRWLVIVALAGCVYSGEPVDDPGSTTDSVQDLEEPAPACTARRPTCDPTLQVCDIEQAYTASTSHACAVRGDGALFCWGRQDVGGFADPKLVDSLHPARVALPEPIVDIEVEVNHNCALGDSGTVYCWGSNQVGELGDGTMVARVTPAPVLLPRPAVALRTSLLDGDTGHRTSCAVLDDCSVHCWGIRTFGTGDWRVATPIPVPGLRATQVELVGSMAIALATDGQVWSWGSNFARFIDPTGPSFPPAAPAPRPLTTLTGIVDLSIAQRQACAIDAAGALDCWAGESNLSPSVAITSLDTNDALCGISTAHEAWCWTGSPGFGPRIVSIPQKLPLPAPVRLVTVGSQEGCMVGVDEQIRCWGGGRGPGFRTEMLRD